MTHGPKPIESSRFTIVSNGFVDGPAQALRDFLLKRSAAEVVTIFHPLLPDESGQHEVSMYRRGRLEKRKRFGLPLRPPFSYAADPFIPLRGQPCDAWIGFNNLAAARGLVSRRFQRASQVIYWCVDFVPNRFGGSVLTYAYDRLDKICVQKVDARVELSTAALEGRNSRLRVPIDLLAPVSVVPMGVWLDRLPTTEDNGWLERRIVYMGHLVPRQGVDTLVEALGILSSRKERFEAHIIGRGPSEPSLRQQVAELGLEAKVTFHGFVQRHEDVEALLASCSVAVAPYRQHQESFTRFADPGKLKSYLAAGLPIVMTDVPPNASELQSNAGALIFAGDALLLADAISNLLNDADEWQRRRAQALGYIRAFDWNILLSSFLNQRGFV